MPTGFERRVKRLRDHVLTKTVQEEAPEVSQNQEEDLIANQVIDLDSLTAKELKALAKDKGIENYSKMNKEDLINALEEE